jgi:hypothetical protein
MCRSCGTLRPRCVSAERIGSGWRRWSEAARPSSKTPSGSRCGRTWCCAPRNATVAARLQLSWDEAAGIQARAARRGLQLRQAAPARYLGIDETAFQRRHEYVTVVTDLGRSRVLYVADDRRRESLGRFWAQWPAEHRATIAAVAMDMWEPYSARPGRICRAPRGKSSSTSSTSLSTPTKLLQGGEHGETQAS